MESGFEDDFAPMQSSNGVVATEDSSFILAQDEAEASVIEPEETEPEPAAEESPKKDSEGGKCNGHEQYKIQITYLRF